MAGELQEVLVGTRVRFAVSFAALLVLFFLWFYFSANWNPDVKLAALFVHDLLLVALYALRFRQLRMSDAWALLAFIPLLGLVMAFYLLFRNAPADERYSTF